MLDCEKFVRAGYIDHRANPLNIIPAKKFSLTPHLWIYEGYTITFVALQLAYYFGFETVLLVGVDHRYQYNGKENQENLMSGDDPNHFDKNYFKGQRWNNPDLKRSEESYRLAKEAYENDGRKIINLTQDSALSVFQTDDINNWM